jgi:cytoskeletal protein RodZ
MIMHNTAFEEEDLYYTDASVGDILRHAREYYQQTIPDIERALRIRASQIDAIERNEFSRLPGKVYAIGFIRAYAEYLNLDAQRVVNLFKAQSAGRTSDPALNFPVAASEGKLPRIPTLIICAVLVVLSFSLWFVLKPDRTDPLNVIPPVPGEMAEAAGIPVEDIVEETQEREQAAPAQEGTSPPAEQTQAAKTTADPILLQVTADSWTEIRDANGKTLVSRVLKAGEEYSIPRRDGITMSLGNAGGVSISLHGAPFVPMGKSGEVMKELSLDIDALEKRYVSDETNAAPSQNPENAVNQPVERPEE